MSNTSVKRVFFSHHTNCPFCALSEGSGGAHSLVSVDAEDVDPHSTRRSLKVIDLFNSLKGWTFLKRRQTLLDETRLTTRGWKSSDKLSTRYLLGLFSYSITSRDWVNASSISTLQALRREHRTGNWKQRSYPGFAEIQNTSIIS